MEKKLEMIFENEEGKKVTLSLDNPMEPIDPTAVTAAMDTIIEQNAFNSSGGDLIRKHSARIVGRIVEPIELE